MRMDLPIAINRKPSGIGLDTKETVYVSDGEPKQESKLDKVLSQPPKFPKQEFKTFFKEVKK